MIQTVEGIQMVRFPEIPTAGGAKLIFLIYPAYVRGSKTAVTMVAKAV